MQFTFEAAFAKGMALFKSRYGGLLAATLVFILLLVGVGLAKALVNSVLGADPDQTSATPTDHLIDIFISVPLTAGIFLIALQHLRGESPAMGTLFAGFRRYWPLVGIGVLLMLIFMAPVVVAALFLGFGFLFIGGTSAAVPAITVTAILVGLVLICIFIMLYTKLIFASLLCIDPRTRLGVCESISTSWRMTGPDFWPPAWADHRHGSHPHWDEHPACATVLLRWLTTLPSDHRVGLRAHHERARRRRGNRPLHLEDHCLITACARRLPQRKSPSL